MTEVTIENFDQIFPQIRDSLKKAKFISLDTEFSSLYIHDIHKPSLFDTIEERYAKVRSTVELIKPLQIGLSAFEFNPDDGSYVSDTYIFYTWPRPLLAFNPSVTYKSSAFRFLHKHKFDFNKLLSRGIPYLTKKEEAWLLNYLKTFNLSEEYEITYEATIEAIISRVGEWYYNLKDVDSMKLDYPDDLKYDEEGKFLLHKNIRSRFGNGKSLFTELDDACTVFTVRRVTEEDFVRMACEEGLEERVVNSALGFTKVFRLLTEFKKPIIGHNIFIDLLLLYNTFENPLPDNYRQFKRALHELFPVIFDTRSICFKVGKHLKENVNWKPATLESMYVYFKDDDGRHLALNSPFIEAPNLGKVVKGFHDAGWDSYCAGYVFVRMAHFLATRKYQTLVPMKVVTSSEHFAAVEEFRNQINLIRCAISHIKIDSDDPISSRPSWLIAQSHKNNRLDLSKVLALLSGCGSVEIKPLNEKQALIAVDNFISERQILRKYKENVDFQIMKYERRLSRHSKLFQGFLLGSLLASGGMLIFFIHKTIK